MNRTLYVLLLLSVSLLMPSLANGQSPKKRNRIGYEGFVISNAISIDPRSNRQAIGDLLAINIEAKQGEQVRVQCHLYLAPATIGKPDEIPDSEYKPAPAINKSYESQLSGGAYSYSILSPPESEDVTATVFFPYFVTAIKPGSYSIRRRITVWVNDALVDDYFIPAGGWMDVTPAAPGRRQSTSVIYRLSPSKAPEVTGFELEGADSPYGNNAP